MHGENLCAPIHTLKSLKLSRMLEKLNELVSTISGYDDEMSQIYSAGMIHGFRKEKLGFTITRKFIFARPVLASLPQP